MASTQNSVSHRNNSSTSPGYVSASLYVGDLNPEVSESMLYEVFNTVGPVASIRVCRDSVTRRSLGYAYINYHSVADAERALDTLNYAGINGQPCRIMWSQRDPSLRKSGNGNIFVKNLDKNIDNKALYDTFSLFGNILSCKVATDEEGKSRGFGFVHYENEHSAQVSIERVNGMLIGGKTVYVGPFIKRSERQSSSDSTYTNIYIKNFPSNLKEDKLRSIFEQYGEIVSLAIKKDTKGRVFAFCNFKEPESAKKAVEALNNKYIDEEGVVSDEDQIKQKKPVEKDENTNDQQNTENNNEKKLEEEPERLRLYVGPFQDRVKRHALLKAKHDQLASDTKEKYMGLNLYIKNLDDSFTDAKLREIFEPFGMITSAKVMKDEKDMSRGFGFVCFVSPEDATKAVTEMHLKIVGDRPLYVGLAEQKEQRLARLQQRFRLPVMRPTLPSGVPTQIQFGAPQIPYGAPPNMTFAPRPMMGFNQTNMIPWRLQGPGQLGPQGGHSMRLQLNPMNMYPQPGMHPGMSGSVAQPHPMPNMGRGGPRMHRNSNNLHSGNVNKTMQVSPKPQPTGLNSFKFTSQARNQRLDQMHPALDQTPIAMNPDTPITPAALAAAQPSMQKQMLGEKLFPLIASYRPDLAGKITGMMLEMDNSELLNLLDSREQLEHKVEEALCVLKQAN